jgi:hypothetical protein
MSRYTREPTTDLSAEELVRRGYRRTSNAYCMVSRIDRGDWLEVMAKRLRCKADELDPKKWADFYRRVYSQDNLTVAPAVFRKIPTSNHDPVGFVNLD